MWCSSKSSSSCIRGAPYERWEGSSGRARWRDKNFRRQAGASRRQFIGFPWRDYLYRRPDGTGKSVTLKLIIALLKPESGHIWIDGEDITLLEGQNLSRVRRKMGFLFQNAALFDFLTLYDNLALPLRRLTRKADQEIDQIIDRVLPQVGLSGDRHKMPQELSGGMRKRAGLARALVLSPKSFSSTNRAADWTGLRPQKSTTSF